MQTTDFDDWLRALSTGGKGGMDGGRPLMMGLAVRGLAWSDSVELPGDWSTATLEGRISASPDAASPLATVTVGTAVYDSGTGITTFPVSLAAGTGANSTGALPADGEGDGIVYFPIEFDLTTGGVTEMLLGAAFPLAGKV